MYPSVAMPVVAGYEVPAPFEDSSCRSRATTAEAMTPRVTPQAAAAALAKEDRWIPRGLATTVARSVVSHPLRIVILDNSGSMQQGDGKRLVAHGREAGSFRSISCSRWQELSADASHLASMSAALDARTDFHLLNPSPGFNTASLCQASWEGVAPLGPLVGLSTLKTMLAGVQPQGTTPLTEAVMNVVSMLEPSAQALRARGEQIAVIIATDGLPNSKETFVQAMQLLQSLPVWVVVRLCTDDESVVSFWNELDAALEAPLEVLETCAARRPRCTRTTRG